VVLRELVAKLGLQVDEAAYNKADKELTTVKRDLVELDQASTAASAHFKRGAQAMATESKKLNSELGKKPKEGGGFGAGLMQYLGGAAVVAGIQHVVELASNTIEAGNVLGEVFGPAGKAQVEAWSETMGQQLGRSKYALQGNVAALGAMIGPMVGNAGKAQEMSQQFAGLAVDLASFFNASDDEALTALKSGISGESEPLKRFGIVMQDATLAEYAHAQGIHKKLAAMNVAEKTELRYRFILANTKKAQGDATRTAGEFANASRALADHVKDTAIAIGMKLLPAGRVLVTWANKAISVFDGVSKHSHIIEGALITLGIIMLSTFGPAIAAAALTAAGFAAVALVIDDLIALFTGGNSAIGKFLDTMFGEGTAERFVASMGEAMGWLKEQWAALMLELTKVDWNHLLELTASNMRALGTVLKEAFEAAWPYIEKVGKVIGFIATKVGDIVSSLASSASESLSKLFGDATNDATAELRDDIAKRKHERQQHLEATRAANAAAGLSAAAPASAAAPPMSAAPGTLTVPGPRAAAGGNVTNITMPGTTIVVPPGTSPTDAAKAAAKSAMIERRKLQWALTRSTGGKVFG
jgi:hypothetical protein